MGTLSLDPSPIILHPALLIVPQDKQHFSSLSISQPYCVASRSYDNVYQDKLHGTQSMFNAVLQNRLPMLSKKNSLFFFVGSFELILFYYFVCEAETFVSQAGLEPAHQQRIVLIS